MNSTPNSVDKTELAKFSAIAAEWWDPNGKFRPLHLMNPCRLDYITAQISAEFARDLAADAPFAGLSILDIGCGGGLLAEPMARLGASVTGIDAAEGTVDVARAHADESGLTIDYRQIAAEDLVADGAGFDVVLAMEIIEHVADPAAFLVDCRKLVKPGGLFICSTLNRTGKSYLAAIVGAEHILRWLPVGTHDWSKFIKPTELTAMMQAAGLNEVDQKGMVLNPLSGQWSISDRDLSVNYIATATA